MQDETFPDENNISHLKWCPDLLQVIGTHHPCSDGFMARTIARRFFEIVDDGTRVVNKIQYLDLDHTKLRAQESEIAETIRGKHVLLIDIAFPVDMYQRLKTVAKSIQILDHHQSAKKEYEEAGFGDQDGCYFHMDYSGAQLAWNFFWLAAPVPAAVTHVANRDLWRKSEIDSFAFCAVLYPQPFEYDIYAKYLDNDNLVAEAVVAGHKILAENKQKVESIARRATPFEFEGFEALRVTLSTDEEMGLISDIGDHLDKITQIAVMIVPKWGKVSLRSDGAGPDVSVLAKKHGGGGHRHAASFPLPNAGF